MASEEELEVSELERELATKKTQNEKYGQILSINEINTGYLLYEDRCIRTWGKVMSHDVLAHQAIIMDDLGEKLSVNTALIEPHSFILGFNYSLIGYILKNENSVILRIHTVACIKELNIELFKKGLELRRRFLNEELH